MVWRRLRNLWGWRGRVHRHVGVPSARAPRGLRSEEDVQACCPRSQRSWRPAASSLAFPAQPPPCRVACLRSPCQLHQNISTKSCTDCLFTVDFIETRHKDPGQWLIIELYSAILGWRWEDFKLDRAESHFDLMHEWVVRYAFYDGFDQLSFPKPRGSDLVR